jgi:hypothetical protein
MSEPTEQAAKETPELNPRVAHMQELARQRQAEIAPELQAFDENTGEIFQEPPPSDTLTNQSPANRVEIGEQQPGPVYRLKVDGQDMEVPADKVIEAGVRALQKESAADKRLNEASILKKQYEDMVREALSAPEPSRDVQEEEDWEQVIKDAPFDEKAAKKLAQRLTASQRINPEELIAPVLNRVERKLEGRDALAEFKSRYSDLMADPNAMKMFHMIERGLVADGDRRPYLDRWADIADQLHSARGPRVDIPVDKHERKATIVNVPSAGARAPQKDEPKPKTVRDIIAETAKSRHQRLE